MAQNEWLKNYRWRFAHKTCSFFTGWSARVHLSKASCTALVSLILILSIVCCSTVTYLCVFIFEWNNKIIQRLLPERKRKKKRRRRHSKILISINGSVFGKLSDLFADNFSSFFPFAFAFAFAFDCDIYARLWKKGLHLCVLLLWLLFSFFTVNILCEYIRLA